MSDVKTLKDILGEDLITRIKTVHSTLKKGDKYGLSIDLLLFHKWAYRVEKGWYGFDLGNTVPMIWYAAIDLMLKHIESVDPNFKIHQIKLKFGGLRFYIECSKDPNIIDELEPIIRELEGLLYNEKLVY